jgi:hypothetical protein
MVFVKMLLAFGGFYDYWNPLSAASGAAIFGQNVLIRLRNDFFFSLWVLLRVLATG